MHPSATARRLKVETLRAFVIVVTASAAEPRPGTCAARAAASLPWSRRVILCAARRRARRGRAHEDGQQKVAGADGGRRRFSAGRPAGGSCARTRGNGRAPAENTGTARGEPTAGAPARRAAEAGAPEKPRRAHRAALTAPRSPGQPKTHRAKSRRGLHALPPAAVSRGLVHQGSYARLRGTQPSGFGARH
jgi:hypothetical protein